MIVGRIFTMLECLSIVNQTVQKTARLEGKKCLGRKISHSLETFLDLKKM